VDLRVSPGTSRAASHRPPPEPGLREGPVDLYLLAAGILVVLNLVDVIITRVALGAGHVELNPLAALFIDHAWIAYPVKVLVPLVVLALACTRRGRARVNDVHLAAIWLVVGIYVMTVIMNMVAVMHTA
jgi:hypothetical protein